MEYVIKTQSIGGLTEDQFYHFCQENESLRFERNPLGDIILMEPSGPEMDTFNLEVVTDLVLWNRQSGLGYVFGRKIP